MKATIHTLWVVGVFALGAGVVYGFVTGFNELAGFPALLATGAMCFMLAIYLMLVLRSTKAILPEDDLSGEISQAAGDYGHFSPWSWWPLLIGGACTILVLGLAIDWWIVGLAVPFAIVGLLGLVYEYSTGDHAH